MFRTSAAVVALGLLAGCASAGGATSWGKPGVSQVDYELDNTLCAMAATSAHAAGRDRSTVTAPNEGAARTASNPGGLRHSVTSGAASANAATNDANQAVSVQTAQDMRERRAQSEARTTCLQARGYREFRLTEEQAAHLRTLRKDSPERAQYLHSLGADPAVVEAQAL